MNTPDVSIIIVSFNTKSITIDCLKSVAQHTKDTQYEVIVVDNASSDGSVEEILKLTQKYKNFRLLQNNENLGFGVGNNLGMNKAKGRYILLLNSDTKLQEDSISKMVNWMDANPNVDVSTCKLINPDGSTQANGGFFPTLPRLLLWSTFLDDLPLVNQILKPYHLQTKGLAGENHLYKKTHPQDWISGAFMLIRKNVFEAVGGFDPKIFMYGEDVEYCYRIKNKGFSIYYVPVTKILHIGSASSGGESVKFIDTALGKESSILGEFKGLASFYKTHFPNQYSVARFLLKTGTILRIILFGFVLGQPQARKIYGKAFSTI